MKPRHRRRFSGTFSQVLSMENALLHLSDVIPPGTTLSPGDKFAITAVVESTATLINPFSADSCESPNNQCDERSINSYCYTIRAIPPWSESVKFDDFKCIRGSASENPTREHTFTMTAPDEPGIYGVEVELRLPGSGETKSHYQTIVVEQDIGPGPGDGDDGGNGDGGTNGGGGGGTGGGTNSLLLGGVALAAGYAAYKRTGS